MENLIDLKKTVTDKKLDAVKIISNIAIQVSQNKMAVQLNKAMSAEGGILWGAAHGGNEQLSILEIDFSSPEFKPLLALIKKAEIQTRADLESKPQQEIKQSDIK